VGVYGYRRGGVDFGLEAIVGVGAVDCVCVWKCTCV
jgi:hypothetical protein